MQRDDQPVIDFYHRVCREAAKRQMLVDFHGATRPGADDAHLAQPDNTEGVRGLERNKWSAHTHPEHNVTLPVHPHVPRADGLHARRNGERAEARASSTVFERPMSQGTRCSPARDVRGLREPAADARRLAVELRARAGDHGVPRSPSPSCGTRRVCSTPASATTSSWRGGAASDWYIGAMTDWSRASSRSICRSCPPAASARRLRGRPQRRPLGERLQPLQDPCRPGGHFRSISLPAAAGPRA